MKPECVSGDEMSDDAWSPQQLCEGVGFLVLEARTPHGVAVKGRVEGPHCPSTPQQGNTHLCCDAADECRRAASVRRQVELFWRNGIPMCIEAALLPACAHGQEAARDTNLEGGSPGSVREENRVLLERWTVNVLPKRHGERSEMSVTPRFLLQAVRSYLHFSQLSAWLSTTKGQLPNPIAYRLLAPGENGSYQFSGKPDLHVFPQADVNQVTVKVSVEALPRIQSIPNVVCRPGNLCGATPLRNFVERSEVAASGLNEKSLPKRCSRDHRLAVNDASNNNTNTRCSDVTNSSQTKLPNSHCSASSERFESADYDQNSNGPSNGQSAKPKVKLKPFDFTAPPGAKSQTKGGKLSHLTPARRKDSPKVLITSSSSTHETFYQKRFLDFDNPDKVHPDTKGQCLDETGWGAMKLSSRLQPEFNCPPRNATEELEAYLSTIAERSLWRDEQLKNIPVRKCKFFIGDQNDELEPSQKDEDVEKTRLHSHPPTTSELADFDSLCKNLYQQDFCDSEEIQQEHLREPDHRKKDFTHSRKAEENVDKLVPFSCQSLAMPPRGEFPAKGEVSPLETNLQLHSPSFVESCVCDAISVQGKITPDVRSTAHSTQNVPAELNNIEQTENISNGNTSPENSVISNGADGKLLQSGTTCKMSTHFEAAILNKGEKASLLKKNFSYLDQPIPSQREISSFHACLGKASGMVFNTSTGLPSRSSPAPIKKKSSGKFDYDSSLTSARAIKNAISCSKLSIQLDNDGDSRGSSGSPNHTLSTSAPASTNSLLGNFEESVLNGRIEPIGVVEGFTAEIGASGAFCPKHVTLPVTSYFFSLSDDNAPSPYLGHINLASSRRRGYHVPKAGTVQVTLFNPNKTVVKMFVVRYDLTDMPPHCQTFLRQRTLYMPVNQESPQPSFLRYLIHLRFFSSKSGKIYLHTDIRLIFARDKFEFDPRVADYELRSFTEGPQNPKFSPKR